MRLVYDITKNDPPFVMNGGIAILFEAIHGKPNSIQATYYEQSSFIGTATITIYDNDTFTITDIIINYDVSTELPESRVERIKLATTLIKYKGLYVIHQLIMLNTMVSRVNELHDEIYTLENTINEKRLLLPDVLRNTFDYEP